MRPIQLSEKEMFPYKNTSFLVLGDENAVKEEKNLKTKISKDFKKEISGIWGTLGWKNDAIFDPKGEIRISQFGNVTLQEKNTKKRALVREIQEIQGFSDAKKSTINDYFIDLSDVSIEFPKQFNINNMPTFRLELFLENNQSAIVFVEHKSKSGNEDEDFEEYYFHEDCDELKRDRMTYFIPAIPNQLIKHIDDENFELIDELQSARPTIRIIIFERKIEQFKSFVKNVISSFNKKSKSKKSNALLEFLLRNERHALLKFNPSHSLQVETKEENFQSGGIFENCPTTQIDPNAKTLLLIHGTFSSTLGSFGPLLAKQGTNDSVLQNILKSDLGYQQILAFDHVTIAENAEGNANWLLDYLGDLNFTNPVDVITTSRGALVAEHISQDVNFNNKLLLNRVLMFSPAHGCGYFKVGSYVGTGLSILKKVVKGPVSKLLLTYLQGSVKDFLSYPGVKMLHVGSEEINKYLSGNAKPNNPNTAFIHVVADWDKTISKDKPKSKTIIPSFLDGLIKGLLGSENDWVIGCEQQRLSPKTNQKPKIHEVHALHGTTFNNNRTHFRNDQSKIYNAQELIIESFR